MNDKPHSFLPHNIQIALTSYPKKDKENFVSNVKNMFDEYRSSLNSYSDSKSPNKKYEYSPLTYHIFGHYDVAFVSLINSYKFPQRVFSSTIPNEKMTNSYQILTGAILKFNEDLEIDSFFNNGEKYEDYPFFALIKLKLNNGLLIGNGYEYKKLAIENINNLISNYKDSRFILLNSFSLFDFTLIVLSKSPKANAEILLKLRQLKICNLRQCPNIIQNSFYNTNSNFSFEQISDSHIFVDTHSHFGINYDKFTNGDKAILETPFLTTIEWKTKPGHLKTFWNNINKQHQSNLFHKVIFKAGKTDYITIESQEETLASNHKVFLEYRKDKNKLYDHIRKLKTTPVFEIDLEKDYFTLVQDAPCSLTPNLEEFAISNVPDILNALKSIKVSRLLRKKIEKVFVNYNAGILDSISCIYFVDFYPFLSYLKEVISKIRQTSKKIIEENDLDAITSVRDNNVYTIGNIESNLHNFIKVFENAYDVRILNSYNYEDFNEFSIGFNSSITQIISTNDVIIKFLSPLFFDIHKKIIVGQIDIDSLSNPISINFNIYHLLEPNLVFNTMVKEILNSFDSNIKRWSVKNENQLTKNKELDDSIELILDKKKIKNSIDSEFINKCWGNIVDFRGESAEYIIENFLFSYFEKDYIKYYFTFNADTQLYVYWSWVYFLQNTSMYNISGQVHEELFIKELTRILLTLAVVDPSYLDNEIECPIPELTSYWESVFFRLKRHVKCLASLDSIKQITDAYSILLRDHILQPSISISGETRTKLQNFINTLNKKPVSELHDIEKKVIERYKCNYDTFGYKISLEHSLDSRKFHDSWFLINQFYIENHDLLKKGQPIIYDYQDETKIDISIFYRAISYTSLRWYYEMSKGKIALLDRDVLTGEPVSEFLLKKGEVVPFLVDPNGGFFIYNNDFKKQSLKFKNAILESLIHLGQIIKKQFFFNNNQTL